MRYEDESNIYCFLSRRILVYMYICNAVVKNAVIDGAKRIVDKVTSVGGSIWKHYV